jgi:hypothetical protein
MDTLGGRHTMMSLLLPHMFTVSKNYCDKATMDTQTYDYLAILVRS